MENINKEVKEIKEEFGSAIANFKDGRKQVIKTKTTYTYYKDGTNDCHVDILDAIESGAVPLQPEGTEKGDK